MNPKYKTSVIVTLILVLILFSFVYVSADDADITITSSEGSKPIVNYGFDAGQENEMNPITLIDGYNKVTYNNNAKDKREYANIAAGGKFIFKNKKLNSSDFVATKDSEYAFGNQKVKVPKDAHVIFKDNKVTIELPKNAVIEKPKKIPDSKEEEVKVEYRYKQGKEPSSVKVRDNDKEYEIKKFGNDKFQINYDGKVDAFRVDGKFDINGIRVGEHSSKDETYLFFDGNAHDDLKGSYVSFGDKKLIVGASKGEYGSTVQFLSGNGILNVNDKTMMIVQAIGGEKGGHMAIESRDSEGKIPKMTATEGYNLFSGNKVLKYIEDYKDKYKGPGLVTKNPLSFSGKESIPIQVVTLDNSGKRIGDWDVVIDSYGSIKAGNAGQLESGLASKSGGFVTSIRTSFHSLTQEEQNKLSMLSPDKQRELVGASVDKLREELKKTPATTTPPPGTKPDTKPGSTPPPGITPTPPGTVKIGDKIKESDKTKYKTVLKSAGVTTSTKGNFDGVYNEITTSDGKKLTGYVLTGQFTTSANSWSTSNNFNSVAIINKDIYLYKKIPCTTTGCNYNWVKYRTIK